MKKNKLFLEEKKELAEVSVSYPQRDSDRLSGTGPVEKADPMSEPQPEPAEGRLTMRIQRGNVGKAASNCASIQQQCSYVTLTSSLLCSTCRIMSCGARRAPSFCRER